MEGCLACDLSEGRRELPGGRIFATDHWVVEHCIGPLGVGTLVVKPFRHVTHLWELRPKETAELGPLLRRVAAAVEAILIPEQVYVCLWSHAHWEPGHIHFVVQPATREHRDEHERPGAFLQADLFEADQTPPSEQVEEFARKAREAIAQMAEPPNPPGG